MSYKLTIDVNIMHEDPPVPFIDTLKRWKEEGKIELVEANPPRTTREPSYGWPGSPPRPMARRPAKREAGNGVNFKTVAAILFPSKDSQKLALGEINNVAHLVKHHLSKHEFFVTRNVEVFIAEGKRDRLRNSFGIVTMTPNEVVETLIGMEKWK